MNDCAWQLQHDVDLQPRNTLGVAARAPRLLTIFDPKAIPEALSQPMVADSALLPLGGGSNLLFVDNPQATVMAMANDTVRIIEHRSDHAVIHVGAGMRWHALVMWSLENGLSGLENLALIPGTVGAAPIQNIGAYGVQVEEFISAVHAWDRTAAAFVRLDPVQCQFDYRDSLFKQQPDRWLITAVELRLPLLSELRTGYAGIAEEMQAQGVTLPTALDVARAVIAIRQRKLPDPNVLGNAGSFFKNPIVPAEVADELLEQHPTMPVFNVPDGTQRKLSAAWLIERAGWKGRRIGDAGISPDHALVLVNHGAATGAELLALARQVAADVADRFAIAIEPEPRLIGATW